MYIWFLFDFLYFLPTRLFFTLFFSYLFLVCFFFLDICFLFIFFLIYQATLFSHIIFPFLWFSPWQNYFHTFSNFSIYCLIFLSLAPSAQQFTIINLIILPYSPIEYYFHRLLSFLFISFFSFLVFFPGCISFTSHYGGRS